MARTIDLTGKLGLGEHPRIIVAEGVELTVDDSAPTIIQVIGAVHGEMTNERMLKAFDLLFGEDERARLDGLGMTLAGYMRIIEAALELVMGGSDDSPKAGETPDTTS